ncbi:hypothetical protein [Vulcanococcus limneticus]|uniref:hypothetical protein n=1 Tax=Vulcanococcus limneticus TaxID=2170428 RepID=UPI001E339A91|nr:hypothetical protein [Vulcanococcus limneticus]
MRSTRSQPRAQRPASRQLRTLLAVALAIPAAGMVALPARANSPLLDSVKQNPQLARSLCNDLKALNAQGLSATSPQAVAMVASRQGLNKTDAEILTTYVVGLHCPEVR